ncbi:unnamed protein product [Cuscuta epithymum]|uniref:Uncharacterized protein n=1 Tax=Cuscuta epithymum TaxID=186058 RepID=A0AAV0DJT3_9ASTE|nr:unnamed protein product [Cuscuta epithymum]
MEGRLEKLERELARRSANMKRELARWSADMEREYERHREEDRISNEKAKRDCEEIREMIRKELNHHFSGRSKTSKTSARNGSRDSRSSAGKLRTSSHRSKSRTVSVSSQDWSQTSSPSPSASSRAQESNSKFEVDVTSSQVTSQNSSLLASLGLQASYPAITVTTIWPRLNEHNQLSTQISSKVSELAQVSKQGVLLLTPNLEWKQADTSVLESNPDKDTNQQTGYSPEILVESKQLKPDIPGNWTYHHDPALGMNNSFTGADEESRSHIQIHTYDTPSVHRQISKGISKGLTKFEGFRFDGDTSSKNTQNVLGERMTGNWKKMGGYTTDGYAGMFLGSDLVYMASTSTLPILDPHVSSDGTKLAFGKLSELKDERRTDSEAQENHAHPCSGKSDAKIPLGVEFSHGSFVDRMEVVCKGKFAIQDRLEGILSSYTDAIDERNWASFPVPVIRRVQPELAGWEIFSQFTSKNSRTEPHIAFTILAALCGESATILRNNTLIWDADRYLRTTLEHYHQLATKLGSGSCHYMYVGSNRVAMSIDGFRLDSVTSMMCTQHVGYVTEFEADVNLRQIKDLFPGLFTDVLIVGEDVKGLPTVCILVQEEAVGFDYLFLMINAGKWIKIVKKKEEDGENGSTETSSVCSQLNEDIYITGSQHPDQELATYTQTKPALQAAHKETRKVTFDPFDLPSDVETLNQMVYHVHGGEIAVPFCVVGFMFCQIQASPRWIATILKWGLKVLLVASVFCTTSCFISVWHDTSKDCSLWKLVHGFPLGFPRKQVTVNSMPWEGEVAERVWWSLSMEVDWRDALGCTQNAAEDDIPSLDNIIAVMDAESRSSLETTLVDATKPNQPSVEKWAKQNNRAGVFDALCGRIDVNEVTSKIQVWELLVQQTVRYWEGRGTRMKLDGMAALTPHLEDKVVVKGGSDVRDLDLIC